jgi:hypothetical protein
MLNCYFREPRWQLWQKILNIVPFSTKQQKIIVEFSKGQIECLCVLFLAIAAKNVKFCPFTTKQQKVIVETSGSQIKCLCVLFLKRAILNEKHLDFYLCRSSLLFLTIITAMVNFLFIIMLSLYLTTWAEGLLTWL